jgi:hypothetical protein
VNEPGGNRAAKEPLPGRLGYLGKSPGLTLSQPARGNAAASASVISTVPSAATAGVGPPNGWTCETPRGAGRRTGSRLTGNVFASPVRYELFVDSDANGKSHSVKPTTVARAFPRVASRMLFLFDYGDEWRFQVEVTGLREANGS